MKKHIKLSRKNKKILLVIILLLLFPLFIGFIYALPLPQIIVIGSGDLLSYYGVTFGIFGSFLLYSIEKNSDKKERISKLKPKILINVGRNDFVYTIIIKNLTEQPLSFLYLYDEYISENFNEEYKFSIIFNSQEIGNRNIDFDYNIVMDDDIIDGDGYPKYVQIMCDDIDGNAWCCYYSKIKDGENIYYYPSEIQII